MRLRLFLATSLFALSAAACSSSSDSPAQTSDTGVPGDDGGTDTAGPITAAQACDAYTQALCDKLSSCLGVFVNVAFGDGAACKARYLPKCLDAAKASGITAQPADLAACADAAKSASCESLLNNDPPAACTPKKGTVDNGAPCGDDGQCKSGFCGFDDTKRICGVCGGAPAAGATCADGKKCGKGLVCATNGKCAAPGAEGATCGDAAPCQTNLSCTAGKCAKRLATEGAACSDTTPECDATQGLFCVQAKCQKVTFAAEGKPCGAKIDTSTMPAKITSLTLCNAGGWCKGYDPTKSMLEGTCTKPAADGEACGTDTTDPRNPPCIAPALCLANKCTYPLPSSCK